MNQTENILDLLRHLTREKDEIVSNVYLFGSVITDKETPNDIDIVVITRDRAGTSGWHEARRLAADMKDEFAQIYEMPLSVMLLTPDEWAKTGVQFVKDYIVVL